MTLILKKENNNYYLDRMPKAGVAKVRYSTGVELLRLQKNKKKWCGNNLELRDSLPLLIYSPSSDRHWYRLLGGDHDIRPYLKYIKDGNLYIYFDDKWKDIVVEEREKEGMKYYDYNYMRHLLLLEEKLDKTREGREDYNIKKRAIEIEKRNITTKYK